MFPSLFQSLKATISLGDLALIELFNLLKQICNGVPKEDVRQHYKSIFKFFLVSFDIRHVHSKLEQIELVENSIVSAFVCFVLKLSEALLKPLLLKLIEWTGVHLNDDSSSTEVGLSKGITIFRLLDSLLDTLKDLFIPYCTYFMDLITCYIKMAPDNLQVLLNESNLLTYSKNVTLKRKLSKSSPIDKKYLRNLLANYLLAALHKISIYDSVETNFIDGPKFQLWMESFGQYVLTGLVDRTIGDYPDFIENTLAPCIAGWGNKLKEHEWKPLNLSLLSHTRSLIPAVRYAGIYLVSKLYGTVGLPILTLLPETMSYVSELMEDEDLEVEKMVRLFIKQIEEMTGESIQNYL